MQLHSIPGIPIFGLQEIHRGADAAHHYAASAAAEQRRASLGNALPNAKTPGYFVRTVPHARRLRGLFFPAMKPLLRSRINARSVASPTLLLRITERTMHGKVYPHRVEAAWTTPNH
jgi:hypothetical protein